MGSRRLGPGLKIVSPEENGALPVDGPVIGSDIYLRTPLEEQTAASRRSPPSR